MSDLGITKRPEGATAPIDVAVLMERCMGMQALAEKLVGMFERQAGEDVAAIGALVAERDAASTARRCHALKGAAAAVGAEDIRRAAADLEQAAKESRVGALGSGLERLKGEVERCLAFVPSARAIVGEWSGRSEPRGNT